MKIEEGANTAVVVKRAWANLHGVQMFLHEHSVKEIRGVDESHILFSKVLDLEVGIGVWIELDRSSQTEGSTPEHIRMLIPWSEVLALVVAKQFSPAIRQEARRIGFTGETQSD